jgi:hypothetical protein
MANRVHVIAVAITSLVGALALSCIAGAFMLFAAATYGNGGNWGAPLSLAIATYASWPTSQWFPDASIAQLATIGLVQWAIVGGFIGFAVGGVVAITTGIGRQT